MFSSFIFLLREMASASPVRWAEFVELSVYPAYPSAGPHDVVGEDSFQLSLLREP